jgi:hypothetical protein
MMDDDMIVLVWKIIATALVVLALGVSGCQAYQTKLFVDGKYCETRGIGQSEKLWVKCEVLHGQ